MRLIVEADGGSRGNPGPSGYGALVRDAETGSVIARRNGFLGTTTNNVAEYNGLLAGLRAAQQLDPGASLEIRMDSKLVIEQVSGRWQVKHPVLRPLAREAVALLATFPKVGLSWIPRASNADADRLANEAMDARSATYDHLDDLRDDLGDDSGSESVSEPAAVATAVKTAEAPAWAGPQATPCRLVMLRHGQTPMSIDRRFSGSGDPSLTDLGRKQAAAAAVAIAAGPNIRAIVSSPLGRARQTAQTVAGAIGVDVAVVEDWREMDFGSWEGLTFAEVCERDPEGMQEWLGNLDAAPHGGESFRDVAGRVATARDRIIETYAGENVVVVSHVTPIKVVAALAVEAPLSALFRMNLDLCSITTVDAHADGKAVLRSLNVTSHHGD